jgi:uncharacterized protein (TIGR02646 family)
MRKSDRHSVQMPPILRSPTTLEARRRIDEFLGMEPERRLQHRAPVDRKLLSDPSIKAALFDLFQNKCAYCETLVAAFSPGDVDHFRPVANAANRHGPEHPHHYAWFAYEWENLYLSCIDCSRYRRSLFPVVGPRAPFFSSIEEAREQERALLIDPCHDEPQRHLDYFWDGSCRGRTKRGKATIDAFGLNAREHLVVERAGIFSSLAHALEILDRRPPGDRFTEPFFFKSDVKYYGAALILLHRTAAALAAFLGRRAPAFNDRLESAMRALINAAPPGALEKAMDSIRSPTGLEDLHAPEAPDLAPRVSIPSRPSAPKAVAGAAPPSRTLAKIHIENFKGIEALDFDLPATRENGYGASCLMLLGENATGKSSILEAIGLAILGAKQAEDLPIKADDYLRRKDPYVRSGESARWRSTDTDMGLVRLTFHGEDSATLELKVDPIEKRFDGKHRDLAVVLAYGPRRYFSLKHRRKKRGAATRVRTLFDAEATIAHPREWLDGLDDNTFFTVAKALREILALNLQDSLIRDLELGICVSTFGAIIPIDRMSEGYKSVFAMSVDIMRELLGHWSNLEDAHGIVLVDEIETHLHPRWKMRVMSALRSAMPNVQFIATTHDPLCLRGMEDREVQVLRRDADQHIDRMLDLPSISGMRAEQILTSDYFGLSSTADPATEVELARYAAALTRPPEDRSDSAESAAVAIGEHLAKTIVIGDTAAEQVVQDAIKIYLADRRGASVDKLSRSRRAAVSAVLAAFQPPSGSGQ